MKKTAIIIITILSITIFQSCICEKGSGELKTEDRELTDFSKIYSDIPGKVILQQSDTYAVRVKTDDNLLESIETTVKRGTLKIKTSGCIKNISSLEVFVSSPKFEEIELSGSGEIKSADEIRSEEIEISVSGSGKIDIYINTSKTSSEISGSGAILLGGVTGEHSIEISGSGALKAYNLLSKEVEADISGAGICRIYVSEKLEADISGSGNIYYRGNPKKINSDVSGSGSIKTK